MRQENVLKISNLYKYYDKKLILDDVSLTIKKGSIYGLIGENGAGKTTLMRIILGFTSVSKGEVIIESNCKLKIGAIIEEPAFYSYLNAKQNLEYYAIQKGIKDKTEVDNILKFVKLHDAGKKKFSNFSLGMKQRLGLGLALLDNPDILILDEPINGLDPKGIKEIRDIFIKINKEKGTTILISSHILSELSLIATEYGFIHKGKLIQEINASELDIKCKNYLEIEVDNQIKACEVLKEKLNLKGTFVNGDKKVLIEEHSNESNVINRALVESGVDVYSLTVSGSTLEEYFLKIIGGES